MCFRDNYCYYLYNIIILLDSSKGELIGLLQARVKLREPGVKETVLCVHPDAAEGSVL